MPVSILDAIFAAAAITDPDEMFDGQRMDNHVYIDDKLVLVETEN